MRDDEADMMVRSVADELMTLLSLFEQVRGLASQAATLAAGSAPMGSEDKRP